MNWTKGLSVGVFSLLVGSASADTLLYTHFAGTGSSVSGGTLSGFDYPTFSGLLGGSMALIPGQTTDNSDNNTSPDSLFALNQSASDSHFAPDVQIDRGQWVADLSFTLLVPSVTVDSIDIERQHLNNGAGLNSNSGARDYPMIVSLVGSTSGSVASFTVNAADNNWGNSNATETFNMGGVTLTNAESWAVRVQVNDLTTADSGDAGIGVYVALDQLWVLGTVPEPSSLALLGLGGLMISRRRRG